MSELLLEISFDDRKLQQHGVKRSDAYSTLKKRFAQKGLPCIQDDDMLVFTGTGRNEDYGHMWFLIIDLIECDWFADSVSHYVFVENNKEEDVLSQIPKVKKMLATA